MSCSSSRSIFNIIGYANIDTIGSWLKECLRGNASISHGKEDMEVSNGDTLIRASLLALAGSRRAPCWGWRDSAVAILEREVAVNDPLWPKCGANCCQWVVYNHWLYWQPALLPGGLWQHFSSIPTFLLPRALQCFHPEVNIDEVTLSTLSMLFHNKTCTRSAMESVIVGKGF